MMKTREMKVYETGRTKRLTAAAMFLALGLVLPFLTGQIPSVGSMLLPMHIPVLLCGFLCGWQYGLAVGLVVPLFRSVLFGMPPMMPTAVCMAFELAAYGLVSGWIYEKTAGWRNKVMRIFPALLSAMVLGRMVWGIVSVILYGVQGNAFSWQLFVGGALLNAIPGIVLQLVIIPAVVILLERASIMKE